MAGLNETPSGERTAIGFFGRRNAGKSSLVNAVTGQDLVVVSDVLGTTTDPVSKAMELLPLGPVLIIDTPGFDDTGELGELRIRRTKQVLNKTDIAVLVIDATAGFTECERQLLTIFKEKNIKYVIVYNKADLKDAHAETDQPDTIYVSSRTGQGINELKERLANLSSAAEGVSRKIVGDLLVPGQLAVLVTPIDSSAPKGRLILPQQQTIRDILDADAMALVVKENELADALRKLTEQPAIVITDSQAFSEVAAVTPPSVPLTSFSILMARYKGFLESAIEGVAAINKLKDGDTVLISEGCTHHRQCADIGTVKIPNWLHKFTDKQINIVTSSGTEFPEDLSPYAVVIHCGGCMLNEREVTYRMKCALDQNVPFTNYGIVIAYIKGILARSLEPFPDLLKELKLS